MPWEGGASGRDKAGAAVASDPPMRGSPHRASSVSCLLGRRASVSVGSISPPPQPSFPRPGNGRGRCVSGSRVSPCRCYRSGNYCRMHRPQGSWLFASRSIARSLAVPLGQALSFRMCQASFGIQCEWRTAGRDARFGGAAHSWVSAAAAGLAVPAPAQTRRHGMPAAAWLAQRRALLRGGGPVAGGAPAAEPDAAGHSTGHKPKVLSHPGPRGSTASIPVPGLRSVSL